MVVDQNSWLGIERVTRVSLPIVASLACHDTDTVIRVSLLQPLLEPSSWTNMSTLKRLSTVRQLSHLRPSSLLEVLISPDKTSPQNRHQLGQWVES